jgi:hypothetical protein
MFPTKTPSRDFTAQFLLFVLVVAVILLCFYWPVLAGQCSYYIFDTALYFEPLCEYMGRSLRQGHIPLWNNLSYCGMSQIAIPSPGLFYPVNWLFALTEFSRSLSLSLLLAQLIASAGTFGLVRKLGWGNVPAIFAGLAYGLSGYMFSLDTNYTIMATAAWLPVLLWSLLDFPRELSPRVGWTGLTCAAMVLCGRPEIYVPSLILSAAFITFGVANGGPNLKRIGFQCFGLLIGLLLACPALIPAFEWMSLSRRAAGLAPEEALRWSANWYDLLGICLPQPLGDLELHHKYSALVASGRVPFVASAFVGQVTIVLACVGLMEGKWKLRWAVAFVLFVSLTLASGSNVPMVSHVVSLVPALAILRYPIKLLFLPIFCLSILAARGMNQLLRRKLSKTKLAWMGLIAGCILSFCFCCSSVDALNARLVTLWSHQTYCNQNIAHDGFQRLAVSLSVFGFIWGANAALFCLFQRRQIAQRLLVTVLIGELAGSLLLSAFQNNRHFGPPQFYKQGSFVAEHIRSIAAQERLQESDFRVGACYQDPFESPPWRNRHDDEENSIEFAQYARQLLFPNTHLDAQVSSTFAFEGSQVAIADLWLRQAVQESSLSLPLRQILISSQMMSELSDEQKGPQLVANFRRTVATTDSSSASDLSLACLCQVTATKFLLTQMFKVDYSKRLLGFLPYLNNSHFRLLYENAYFNCRVYIANYACPRFYLADEPPSVSANAQPVSLEMCSLSELRTLVLPDNLLGSVRRINETPESINLEANCRERSLLVVADTFYPGWGATVDGISKPLVKVNQIARGVVLSPGNHIVRMSYQPASLAIGLVLALFGFALLLITFTWKGGTQKMQ